MEARLVGTIAALVTLRAALVLEVYLGACWVVARYVQLQNQVFSTNIM